MKENNQENTAIEPVENTIVEVEKPYKFRKLCAKDIPLMMKIIAKIKLNKFTDLLHNKELTNLFKGNNEEDNSLILGGTLILDAAQIILEGLGDCEEIFEMLANVSEKKVEDIEALEIDVLMEMIIDFIKKEEFVGFFKAVLKLIK